MLATTGLPLAGWKDTFPSATSLPLKPTSPSTVAVSFPAEEADRGTASAATRANGVHRRAGIGPSFVPSRLAYKGFGAGSEHSRPGGGGQAPRRGQRQS